MKRDEMDALIAGYERAAETNPAHTDLIIHVTAISLRALIALARLGASVAEPTSVEQRQMATALKAQADKEALDDEWRVSITFAERLARAAILTLKDRANV